MKSKLNNNGNRKGMILDKIEDVFMTISSIVIGLSPLLVFV